MPQRIAENVSRRIGEHQPEARQMQARTCDPSVNGWDQLAEDIGCTRSALLDVLGHAFSVAGLRTNILSPDALPWWPVIVRAARRLDRDRRSRYEPDGASPTEDIENPSETAD